MYNPIIIVAILAQWLVSKYNRVAGAILGFVITAGILLWGLTVYSAGGAISLFGIELSGPVFVIICLFWFGFDYWDLQNSRKAAAAKAAALQSQTEPKVEAAEVSKQD